MIRYTNADLDSARYQIEAAGAYATRAAGDPFARRRISGIIAPYGTTANVGGVAERYAPGVFTRTGMPEPLPALVDEQHAGTIGRCVALEERADGLWGEFELANTTRGAEVAELAEIGALWGLSAGFVPGDNHRDGRTVVHTRGDLRHVAITAAPAYRSARVLAVREETMEDTNETPPAPPAPPAEVHELRSDVAALAQQVAALVAHTERPATRTAEPSVIRTPGEWLHTVALARLEGTTLASREAIDRLQRAAEEIPEMRAAAASTGSANIPAQMPDAFLGPVVDRVIAGSPTLTAFGRVGLSQGLPATGMDIHRPVVSQGTSVAWEAAEGDEGDDTQFTTSDVTGAIKAVKTRNRLTLQAATRSDPSAIDALLRDQAAAIATGFDTAMINGTGTVTTSTGTLAGMLDNGSIDDAVCATWTTAAFLAAFNEALASVMAATNSMPLMAIMHSRRYGAIRALGDTAGRPIMDVAGTGQNTWGSAGAPPAGTPLGGPGQPSASILGVPVVVDNNIATNLGVGTDEDIILMVGAGSFEVFHDATRQLQLQLPDDFQTTFGMAKFGALLPIRPAGLCTISGDGLV